MLSQSQLVDLERALRSRRVLSVYLDGTASDPAMQRAWRVDLDHGLKELRSWLDGSPHQEREELERCLRLLEGELATLKGNVGAPGWAAFLTADRIHHATPLPVPMPTRAVWSTGISVAPYLRALKEARPVAMAVADATIATIYRYAFGALEHVETIRAHHVVMPPSHMGNAPRSGFHSGTRGATGHDEAQRSLLEGTNRMVAAAAASVMRVAGGDGWIVTGGIPEISRKLAANLPAAARHRVFNGASIDVHSSQAELIREARAAASALRDAEDADRIAEISDRGQALDLGALGPAAARQALEQSRVRELYFTHRYLEDHAAEAEDAVRAALGQGASVEEVSGAAADSLDAQGGVAARLRYRLESEAPRP